MNFLIIDTCGVNGFVVAQLNNKKYVIQLPVQKKHSENLLVSIDELLIKAKLKLSDIDVVGCVLGPGSFTGIRIALSTILGFSAGQNFKVVGANIFDVLKSKIENGIVLMPSTKSNFYYGKYSDGALKSCATESYDNLDKILENQKNVYVKELEQINLNTSYNNYDTINDYTDILFSYFKNEILNNNFLQVSQLQPFYLQLSQAEKDLKNVVKK